jgi:hypothetical protein
MYILFRDVPAVELRSQIMECSGRETLNLFGATVKKHQPVIRGAHQAGEPASFALRGLLAATWLGRPDGCTPPPPCEVDRYMFE